MIPTGIDPAGEKSADLRVFPNPVNNQITVDLSAWEGSDVKLELYNVYGQFIGIVFDEKAVSNKLIVDETIQDLPAGIFLLKATTSEGMYNCRFLKM